VIPLLLAVLLAALVAGLAALAWALFVALGRERERAATELARTRAEAAELRARVEALAAQAERAAHAQPEEFVITHLGEPDEDYELSTGTAGELQRIDGRLFADLVLRESLVKAAALGHGVRRALAPETRNRIRFEMKRELKRSRRARKDEYRRVREEIRARERAAVQ
jgi:hypothetical protein